MQDSSLIPRLSRNQASKIKDIHNECNFQFTECIITAMPEEAVDTFYFKYLSHVIKEIIDTA